MEINDYVKDKKELNQKMQEYSFIGYKMKLATNNSVVMVKKDYNTVLLIVLLILGIFMGLVYYLLSDKYTVNIEINPSKSEKFAIIDGDGNITPVGNVPYPPSTNINDDFDDFIDHISNL